MHIKEITWAEYEKDVVKLQNCDLSLQSDAARRKGVIQWAN